MNQLDSLVIRAAQPADAELLPEIERSAGQAFLDVPGLAWIAEDEVQPPARHLELIAGGHSWVATDGKALVGFLSAERLDDTLHVWELAVAHGFQGRGIGRALLAHAIDVARRRKLAAVTLTTFRDVRWNEPFYRKLGFRTLDAGTTPARLQAILDRESASGLPRDRRCAMLLALR
jgi:ribosomal protein S18 acetylase RimI-like enzyme